MARVPNIDRATVDPRMVTEYLLGATHRIGGPKARLLKSFGFDPAHLDVLIEALHEHGRLHAAQPLPPTRHGAKYVVRGFLKTPNGRPLQMRTVWIIDAGAAIPRFVTAVPE